MTFNHICIVVSDMEKAKHLWCDVLGFYAYSEMILPETTEPYSMFKVEEFEDIWGGKGCQSLMVGCVSAEGAFIELQQSLNPVAVKVPAEERRYGHGGIREIALTVTDIDGWFEKIQAAGYEVQTPYVWTLGNGTKSFLFYDDDGNQIQLVQVPEFDIPVDELQPYVAE